MSLVDDYESAVRRGAPEANYLAQMLAASAGININANDVAAAPASMLHPVNDIKATANQGSFWGGIGGAIDNATNTLMSPFLGKIGEPLGGAAKVVSDVAGNSDKAMKFITDIPRVATTLLGLILIIAGIFALAKGPAVQIMGAAKGIIP